MNNCWKLCLSPHPCLVDFIKSIEGIHGKPMMAYVLYMAQRIKEMHRVLKEAGSIYLHCDPTASHYLKIVMDDVFGRDNFRNEIVWCYTAPSGSVKSFPKKHDIILFYTKSDEWTFNADAVRIPYKKLNTNKGQSHFGADVSLSSEVRDEYLQRGKMPESWWARLFTSRKIKE